MKSITAPATRGPTEAINKITATTINQTAIGMSSIFIPGARAFIVVVIKLIPPSRNETNSSATARIHKDAPQSVRLYSATEESGGYAVQAPPKPPPLTKKEAINTNALTKKI